MSESSANPSINDLIFTQQAPAARPPEQSPQQIAIDDSKASPLYANFCRVTGTPEEMIIDFALNTEPFAVPTTPIAVTQRIVTSFFTAKRLWQALGMTFQRHEAAFGVLETDVQKRGVAVMRHG